MNSAQSKQNVMSAFASLPPKQQRILYLIRFEGFSIKEVAEQLQESVDNTRHEFYLGIKTLKETLFPKRSFEVSK